jgi:hypothetical protein
VVYGICHGASTGVEAVRERFVPALDTLDETVRHGRRTILRGQRAAEDAARVAVESITQGMIHGSGRMCTAPLPFSTLRAFVAADQPGCRQRVQLERLLERFAV